MNRSLDNLIALLRVQPLGGDTFVGQSQDLGWGQMFGGQALGQALWAATQTVPRDRLAHSLHAYFLRPGNAATNVLYQVERIRDGRSFSTRRVVASQNQRPIFTCSLSFHIAEEGLTHQDALPSTSGPDGLLSNRELSEGILSTFPPHLRDIVAGPKPIEIRQVEPRNPLEPRRGPPHRQVWLRASDELPDDPALHQALLAYSTDFSLLPTVLEPHGVSWMTSGMQVTSLDHAIWFHKPARMDTWHLHDMESPQASASRGIVRGRLFSVDGDLVATVTQEGLIRQRA